MVAAQKDRRRTTLEKGQRSFGDQSVRFRQVAGNGRKIAIIHPGAMVEDIDLERRVIGPQQHRLVANPCRPKARTDAVGAARIKGDAGNGKIDAGQIGDMGQPHKGANPRIARVDHGVEGLVANFA